VTNAQLTAALEQARSAITADVNAQYAGRIAALESELTSMQTSVDDLAIQRDALLAQNDSLRASLNSQSDFSPWLAAAVGAAVAAATLAGGYLLARRRGTIRSDRAAVAVRA
jgi:hypothetical protein